MGPLLVLCPGQGSQAPGMAQHLWQFAVAREVFREASEVLGWDVGELCLHAPMEELTRTDRTQASSLVVSPCGGSWSRQAPLSRSPPGTPLVSTPPWSPPAM